MSRALPLFHSISSFYLPFMSLRWLPHSVLQIGENFNMFLIYFQAWFIFVYIKHQRFAYIQPITFAYVNNNCSLIATLLSLHLLFFLPTTSSTFLFTHFCQLFSFYNHWYPPHCFSSTILVYLPNCCVQPAFIQPNSGTLFICFFLHHSACLQPTYVLTSNQFRQPFRVFLRPSASTDWWPRQLTTHPPPPPLFLPSLPLFSYHSVTWPKASVLCSPPLPPIEQH